MSTSALASLHRMMLLVLVTVALVATGFSHRMPAASDAALAYALENGISLADLCVDDLDGDGQRDLHCQACQIAGGADVPTPDQGLIDVELAFLSRVVAPREVRAAIATRDRAHAPQGPPVI